MAVIPDWLLLRHSTSSLLLQVQERGGEGNAPLRDTLTGPSSLPVHSPPPAESLRPPTEPETVSWDTNTPYLVSQLALVVKVRAPWM